ncbi:hypothetical protein [Magpiepox virus 2]|nr:hypothetical protein [Magpiepox virus 2]
MMITLRSPNNVSTDNTSYHAYLRTFFFFKILMTEPRIKRLNCVLFQ